MSRRRELPSDLTQDPFAVHAALACGVSADRMRAHDLVTPFHGVRTMRAPTDIVERCQVLSTRFRPGDVFTGPTAAMLWGMPLPGWIEGGPLHVASAEPLHAMRRRGVHGVRFTGGVVVVRADVPVLDPVDTWLSLAPMIALDDLVAVGDHLVTPRDDRPAVVTPAALERRLAEVGRRDGIGVARRAAALIRVGAWSRPETHLRLLVGRAGFPPPALNVAIAGHLETPDLSWPEFRIAAEYNGRHHDAPDQRRRDLRRAEDIAELGWTTVNVDRDDLYRNPIQIVVRLEARFRARGWSGRVHLPKSVGRDRRVPTDFGN